MSKLSRSDLNAASSYSSFQERGAHRVSNPGAYYLRRMAELEQEQQEKDREFRELSIIRNRQEGVERLAQHLKKP